MTLVKPYRRLASDTSVAEQYSQKIQVPSSLASTRAAFGSGKRGQTRGAADNNTGSFSSIHTQTSGGGTTLRIVQNSRPRSGPWTKMAAILAVLIRQGVPSQATLLPRGDAYKLTDVEHPHVPTTTLHTGGGCCKMSRMYVAASASPELPRAEKSAEGQRPVI